MQIRMPDGELRSIEAVVLPERFDQTIQSWDLAFKDQAGSDYVAGVRPRDLVGAGGEQEEFGGFVSLYRLRPAARAGQEWGRSPKPGGRLGRPCWLVVVGSFETGRSWTA